MKSKRLLCFFMAVALACAGLPGMTAPAGEARVMEDGAEAVGAAEDDFKYEELEDGTLEITGYVGNDTELVIPSEIGGKRVTSIGGNAFYECRSLTSVGISEGVTSIGRYAFHGCGGLTSVNIPGSVTSIGDEAFSGCSGLTSVNIPGSVTSIGDHAFDSCSGLTSVSIPEGVTSIGDHAFWGCSGLTSVKIPKGVTSIGEFTFSGCSGLTSVSIPGSVTSIGDYAFSGCSGLTSVNIPGSVTSIGDEAFSGCSGLTSVSIPEGVTSIGGFAFSGCSGLTSVNIPESVTSIEYAAFGSCSGLKDVYYGGSEEQWHKIAIGGDNAALSSAAIYYDSSGEKPGPGNEDGPSNPPPAQKKEQAVTANNLTKTYGAKPFSLGAQSTGGTKLAYASSDPKVAVVDASGRVTIKGCGVTKITVTAAETSGYKAASKTVTLTVKPKKASLVSVKSKKKKTALVKWKRDAKASGYLVECATDKKFKKNKVKVTVGKNKTTSATVKKLKGRKKYFVRVCAYAKAGNKKIQGEWSKAKTVKVKK